MTEQEQLLQLLKTTLQDGKDFILEQAPSVIQELILWGRATTTLGVCASIIGVLVFTILFFVFIKKFRKETNQYNDKWTMRETYGLSLITSGVMSVATMISTVTFTILALKVWLCPKLYLLDYLKDSLQ